MPAAAYLLASAVKTGNPWLTGCSIFAATMIAVYSASTLSHFVADTRRRRFFRSLDQAFIYTFIVGTYTPFSLVFCAGGVVGTAGADVGRRRRGLLRQDLLGAPPRRPGHLGLPPPRLAAGGRRPLVGVVPSAGLWWVFIGGLCYTLGVVCLTYDTKAPYLHALWHLTVVAVLWHDFAIRRLCCPRRVKIMSQTEPRP